MELISRQYVSEAQIFAMPNIFAGLRKPTKYNYATAYNHDASYKRTCVFFQERAVPNAYFKDLNQI